MSMVLVDLEVWMIMRFKVRILDTLFLSYVRSKLKNPHLSNDDYSLGLYYSNRREVHNATEILNLDKANQKECLQK